LFCSGKIRAARPEFERVVYTGIMGNIVFDIAFPGIVAIYLRKRICYKN